MQKVPANVMQQFKPGGAARVLRTYLKLSAQKQLGEHWLWCALERIANGEPEHKVMADYLWLHQGPHQPPNTRS